MEIDEEEAIKLLEKQVITGREVVFCLKSSENLTHGKNDERQSRFFLEFRILTDDWVMK